MSSMWGCTSATEGSLWRCSPHPAFITTRPLRRRDLRSLRPTQVRCSREADGKFEHSKSSSLQPADMASQIDSTERKLFLTMEDGTPELAAKRRRFFMRYVAEVQPENIEQFASCAPPEVIRAMRETVDSMLGSLPARYFSVSITSVSENLAQLLFNLMLTGYMFRNAVSRMEVHESIVPVDETICSSSSRDDKSTFSTDGGTSGSREHASFDYTAELHDEIRSLRAEVERLRQASAGAEQDGLLRYIRRMEPENLRELTSNISPDTLEAMNEFTKRLLGTNDTTELATTTTEITNTELSRMMYWVMVVGYSLRTMEVKFEMEKNLATRATSPREG